MPIDTPDTPILEQIERLPQGLTDEDINQIRNSVKLSLYAESLAGQKAEVEKICANSEIKEERTFSRKDIEKLIALFAMANKLEVENLKVARIITDKQGTLLVLEVKSPDPDGGYKLISYTLRGRHGNNKSGTTNLSMIYLDKDDMPIQDSSGDTIVEYMDGKWRFLT